MTVRTRFSKADFKRLPEGPPYYEFERGELIEVVRPHPWHQVVVGELHHLLRRFADSRGLGLVFMDCEVDLSPDLAYAPDVLFIRSDHASLYDPGSGEIAGIPDLVVEVISHSHPDRDRVRKFSAYEEVRVPWLWLVDPFTLSIEEYRHTGEHYLRTASVAKGQVFRPGIFPELEINLLALAGEPPDLGGQTRGRR